MWHQFTRRLVTFTLGQKYLKENPNNLAIPMDKHMATVRRKNSLSAGQDLKYHAQEGTDK